MLEQCERNWFDVNNVAAFSAAAWSGNSLGWKHATYNTTALSGSTYIRYAFVFKSDVNLSGDGVSIDDFELTNIVGLDEQNETVQVVLQPNPVNDFLAISIQSSKNNFCKGADVAVHIVDATGREVAKQVVSCTNNIGCVLQLHSILPVFYIIVKPY